MKRKTIIMLQVVLLMMVSSLLNAGSGGKRLIAFTLKDQFNNEYSAADFADQVLVMVLSDKQGSDYNERWSLGIQQALGADHKQEVRFLPVADLRGVPFFVRGIVRRFFPDNPEVWILMDWQGLFAREYQQVEKRCNILLFSRGGELVYQTAVSALDPAEMDHIVTTLRNLIAQP